MKIELDLLKSLTHNADSFFQKSKKSKKKLLGLERAIVVSEKKLSSFKEKTVLVEKQRSEKLLKKRKKFWFERFHWFYSSENRLVLCGRDANSNEELIKNYMKDGDLYFHADFHGASHCIIKTFENFATDLEKLEAAIFSACFSKAWNAKIASLDVFSVFPIQVSKKAPTGESVGKGAFMISGKRNWLKKVPLHLAVGIQKIDNQFVAVCAPLSAVKKHSSVFVRIVQGNSSKNAAAKELKNFFEKKLNIVGIGLDELLSVLPSGGIKIVE